MVGKIFYYSATGNTRFAAEALASRLSLEAVSILDVSDGAAALNVSKDHSCRLEAVGFMFPIYCWGIPPVFQAFMNRVLPAIKEDTYVWSVCTCGDEAGIAMKLFDSALRRARGRGADALFSLIMPNTYVLLPGFDVDSREVEEAKLEKAPGRLEEIAAIIEARGERVFDVHQGSLPALRTRALFPLFRRWGVSTRLWHSLDTCIGCGNCARICPARNIVMEDGRPSWGSDCFSCCACFHCCPVNAVQYGSITKSKSQYLCPL